MITANTISGEREGVAADSTTMVHLIFDIICGISDSLILVTSSLVLLTS